VLHGPKNPAKYMAGLLYSTKPPELTNMGMGRKKDECHVCVSIVS
jgi:hypothetical protein